MNQVNSNKTIKVLIVDDSAFIRVLLTEILDSSPSIQVIATAEDPIDAREKIKKYDPDVITLDVEMPKMDGLTFLKNIMRLRPMPVIMVSTLTQAGADITLEALEYGAFDIIGKPSNDVKNKLTDLADELINKVIAAANCNKIALEKREASLNISSSIAKNYPFEIITIGASTGGTEAIREVIRQLPLGLPPIVMSQHIPATFSTSYAKRLNRESIISVREVLSSTRLESGFAYLAPGSHHIIIKKKDGHFWAMLDEGEKVNRHRPSVDVMFNSIVDLRVKDCLGIVLTGMGKDGAKGLKALKDIGATTFVQDEETSVVWGMPGSSVKEGGVDCILPLGEIAQAIVNGK
ncbi:MAG: two-component system chemotaxis response regulator CheB [Polaribacter sp.]|jgi:two-component system chemotaxis response regulator CheB